MSELTKFDAWIKDGGPAALVIREWLEPVEGRDGVFFPATFAAEQGTDPDRFRGGYHIDEFSDGTNVCLVDTVGSQANRIEPLFLKEGYTNLVPRVVVTAGDRKFSLLEAGHRAADAIVRCSELKNDLAAAFVELLKGNAEPLAKIAPTSLVFGVWDSRGTYAKQARLVSSTIRAFNVYRHKRHAQYNPVIHYRNEGLLDGIDATDDDLAQKGYISQPIGKQPDSKKPDPTHGGVQLMPNGFIRRDATLSLAALRRLAVREANGTVSSDRTDALRRYILGLSLVALTADQDNYLRQGCNLVLAEQPKREFVIVKPNGCREVCTLTHDEAKKFAEEAAKRFVIGEAREVQFNKELAKIDIKGEEVASGLKYEGCDVVSVDLTAKSFVIRVVSESRTEDVTITTNAETKFKKGRVNKSFSDIIAVGARLDLEVSNGVAIIIKAK
jgi:CRISPR-associated protein Csb1